MSDVMVQRQRGWTPSISDGGKRKRKMMAGGDGTGFSLNVVRAEEDEFFGQEETL